MPLERQRETRHDPSFSSLRLTARIDVPLEK